MKTVSISRMKELDRRTIEDIGIASIILMENAGRSVSEAAIDTLGDATGKKIAVFCGIGNNGGDGFVAARYLARQGITVNIYIVGEKKRINRDPLVNLRILEKMGVRVEEVLDSAPLALRSNNKSRDILQAREASREGRYRDVDLIIDAIFGVGLKGEVKEPVRSIIRHLNETRIPIISVDVPSGLDADTGEVLGETIRAKKTVTMQYPKKGFNLNKGPGYCGEITPVDIGIVE